MAKKSKLKQLEKLKTECEVFFQDIYKQDKKVLVFGEGNPDANLVLVGEAPGEHETVQQRPFVGQAGKILDEFLKILEIERENIYITSVVKFRPFKTNPQTGRKSNRPPNKEEIGLSRGWLLKELKIIEPHIVVSLGNVALRTLTDNQALTIGRAHGEFIKLDSILDREVALFPLYHPASIIYRRELKEPYIKDLEKLKDLYKSFHQC